MKQNKKQKTVSTAATKQSTKLQNELLKKKILTAHTQTETYNQTGNEKVNVEKSSTVSYNVPIWKQAENDEKKRIAAVINYIFE